MHSAEGEVSRLLTESELDSLEREIERWLDLSLKENPLLAAFERDSDEPVGESRWFIRVLGEEKDTFTLRFMLRQRMLHYETYVMPAPEENVELFLENLLIRNKKIVGATFCLGEIERHRNEKERLDARSLLNQTFKRSIRLRGGGILDSGRRRLARLELRRRDGRRGSRHQHR